MVSCYDLKTNVLNIINQFTDDIIFNINRYLFIFFFLYQIHVDCRDKKGLVMRTIQIYQENTWLNEEESVIIINSTMPPSRVLTKQSIF